MVIIEKDNLLNIIDIQYVWIEVDNFILLMVYNISMDGEEFFSLYYLWFLIVNNIKDLFFFFDFDF